MSDSILKIKDLSKNFGKREVLKSINLEIKKGEVFGVIGMSGGGKTVLLKTLINFYKPSKGKLLYKGKDINSFSFRRKFGFSTQESCFYPELTVYENLKHFGRLYRLKDGVIKRRIEELLKLLELEDAKNMSAGQLSGGMQKRLDIACALIHEPEVLFLDEPTLELDPILRREVMQLIHKINKEKQVTILMASHLLGGIEAMCDNIAIIHEGRIVEQGSPVQLREIHGKNEEIHLKTEPGNYNKIRNIFENKKEKLGINKIAGNGPGLIIYTKDAKRVLDYLFNNLKKMNERIVDLHLSKPSLTEVFMTLVGGIRESALKNRIRLEEEKAKKGEKSKR
jgi:ABC-2 type transport system ATP-binding protein